MYVETKFVITEFVIAALVITEFVEPDFDITEVVVTKFFLQPSLALQSYIQMNSLHRIEPVSQTLCIRLRRRHLKTSPGVNFTNILRAALKLWGNFFWGVFI